MAFKNVYAQNMNGLYEVSAAYFTEALSWSMTIHRWTFCKPPVAFGSFGNASLYHLSMKHSRLYLVLTYVGAGALAF